MNLTGYDSSLPSHAASHEHPSWQPTIWLLWLLSALFLFVWLTPYARSFEKMAGFLPLHNILETLSVTLAALIFVVGWQSYESARSLNILLLSCVFLTVALLDFGHGMSSPGMPLFVTPASPSKAIAFWLASRFITAMTFFVAIALRWKAVEFPSSRYLVCIFFLSYATFSFWLILFYPQSLPQTYLSGTGYTTFKIVAEYVIAIIYIATAVLILLFIGNRLADNEYSRNLFKAAAIMVLSELSIVAYSSPSDIFNLLGHGYKILAFYFLYRAVYAINIKSPLEKLQSLQNRGEIEKELAQITLSSIGDAIITTNYDGTVLFINRNAEALTGWAQEEAEGKALDEILHLVNQMTRKPLINPATLAVRDNQTFIDEPNNHSLLISRTNKEHAIEYTASPIRNAEGFVLGCVLVLHNISEKFQLMEQISWQAGHDTLTHLPNRTLLSDRISQAIAHASRQQHLLLVCFMDLDGFKAVNDLHGHELGDKLLIEVARRLINVVRSDDTVSRLGGDEFVLLLNEINTMDEVDVMITRVLEEMARPYQIAQQTLKISASIGMTLFPFDSSDTDTLLRHADQAMYQAKQNGRNRFHLFDASMDLQVQEHHQQLSRLEQAINNKELLLHYQPKINLKTSKVIGMEGLIRWQHPEQGLLEPLDFLHLAEDSNLIIDIGNFVLHEALTQIAAWHADGHEWVISVNIAARQLKQLDFIDNLQSILAQYPGAPASMLELEILESSALADMEHVRNIILTCQKMGISVSLDDFGSGYSSLAYLRHLPVNTLKIDQLFVRDMLDDEEDCALVDGILQMARVFKREVVAEGMETAAHGALLLKLGCTVAQGYGIARPMPAAEVAEWAAKFTPDPRWQNYPATLVGWGHVAADTNKVQAELMLYKV
jgi:diguanylate cyclase (GGDEF)-like protein/PAS domain S-box-containing protein